MKSSNPDFFSFLLFNLILLFFLSKKLSVYDFLNTFIPQKCLLLCKLGPYILTVNPLLITKY